MTITFFGIIWFFILVICLFLPFKFLFGALILSSIFQSVSVINFSNSGIYPMLVTEACIILKFFLMKKSENAIVDENVKKLIKGLLLFLIFAFLLSIISPFLFKNVSVYYSYSKSYVTLGFDFSTIVRSVTLLCNILTIAILYKSKNLLNNKFIINCFLFSIMICIIIGFWEFTCKKTNNTDFFPYDFFYNNISYTQGYAQSIASGNVRMNSTFLEPSYLGSFIVSSFFGILSLNKKGKYFVCLSLLLICLVLNLSGTGIITFIVMFFYYLFIHKRFKLKKESLMTIAFVFLIFFLILFQTGYYIKIISMVKNKLVSVSGEIRTSANLTAFHIFQNTRYLGGGLSCFRGSSLIFTFLCEVGVVGFLLFFKPLYDFVKTMNKNNKNNKYYDFGYIYLISVVISMAMAIPDITFMLLWIPIYYLVSIKNDYKEMIE